MIAHAVENAVETDDTGPLSQLRVDMARVRAPQFDNPEAPAPTQELMLKLPKSLRPTAFADDSVFVFTIPNTDEAREALMRLLTDLAALKLRRGLKTYDRGRPLARRGHNDAPGNNRGPSQNHR